MNNITYLFYGFGSEYVLNPLYKEMNNMGYRCIEINALIVKNSKKIINKLIGENVIFITSSHFLLDMINFKDFYPTTSNFYSVLEILTLIKPKKSIYIPHDLTENLITMENYFINQFDLFISPCEPFTSLYSDYCNTKEIGWIKYTNNQNINKKISKNNNSIWFLSDFILHMKMGKRKSFNLLSPVLKQGVSIKFPFWDQYSEFEEYYKKMGASVYPANENSIELIKNHDIIITNGLSSIISESYWLGKTTVNITEGSHYGNMRSYLEELFPNLIFIEKIKDFRLSGTTVKNGSIKLKPFNMAKAIELITKN